MIIIWIKIKIKVIKIKDPVTKIVNIPPDANTFFSSNTILGYTYATPVSTGLKLVVSFSAAYHGMFYTTDGHRLSFGGEQGELVNLRNLLHTFLPQNQSTHRRRNREI